MTKLSPTLVLISDWSDVVRKCWWRWQVLVIPRSWWWQCWSSWTHSKTLSASSRFSQVSGQFSPGYLSSFQFLSSFFLWRECSALINWCNSMPISDWSTQNIIAFWLVNTKYYCILWVSASSCLNISEWRQSTCQSAGTGRSTQSHVTSEPVQLLQTWWDINQSQLS